MTFVLDAEQLQFAEALHDQLAAADVPALARQWAAGDRKRGQALWYSLAEAGVAALAVPHQWDGLGAHPADLVIACEELGHHAVPGPIAESIAAVPRLLATLAGNEDQPADPAFDRIGSWLRQLAAGELVATLAWPPLLPYAPDAELAGLILLAGPDWIRQAEPGAEMRSVHAGRSLSVLTGGDLVAAGEAAHEAVSQAFDYGALASAAQLLGAGRGLLDCAAAHAVQRTQFGSPVGSFQAVKHQLANVLIALEFARPLLFAAAVALADDQAHAPRDVSAAKVACTDAARLAARVALQVHGAIGYTAEHDLSLWLTLVRAVGPAWGSQHWHRARVLAAITGEQPGRAVLTQEQLALRDAVRGLLGRTEPQWAPRSAGDEEEEAADYPGELWQRLCGEIGAAGLTVPERYGGAGAGPIERHVVLEELGRALAPSPLLGSAVLAAEALLGSADAAACDRLLPAMADGSLIAALAWVGPAGTWNPAEVGCTAAPAANGWVLQGAAQYVLDGDIAGLLLVPAVMGEAIGLFEVWPGQPAVTRERATSMDSTRRLASVRLAGAAGSRIGGMAALAGARDAACIALSAEQAGAAGRALELTVAYTKERVQFGRPIGSFQALQHRMASLHVLVESARSISYAAADAAARGADDVPLLAASAKAYCSEALQRVAAEMIQLHGAIGVTWEHKAQLFFKRAHGAAQLFGSAAEHVERVASATIG